MIPASPPADEAIRLATLRALSVLDTPPEEEFDALVKVASQICGAPIALISLVDEHRQWFKAATGLPGVAETPRDLAFCAHAILDDGVFTVEDARADPRFADNPLVTGAPDIRFYAGAPLRMGDGQRVGTLCVIDRRPRRLDAAQLASLAHLAGVAARALQARRSLRVESQTSALLRHSADGIVSLDPDGRVIGWNAAAERLFGWCAADMLGQGLARVLPPGEAAELDRHLEAVRALRDGLTYEAVRRHRDGRLLPVSVSLMPVLGSDGELLGFTKVFRDIGAQRRAADELAAERQRLAYILDATRAGTWEWNVQTGETRFNERWAGIIGWTLAELAAEGPLDIRLWERMVHRQDLARSTAALQAHFDGLTEAYHCEARMRHRDGHWVWVDDRGQVMTRTADGRPEWMYGIHLDITERKRDEEALRRNQALLDRTGRLAGVGGWELDLADGTLTWSDETCRLHGVPIGHRPTVRESLDHYPEPGRRQIEAAARRCIETGAAWDLELPLRRADGRTIWARSVGTVEHDASGRAVRLVGGFQDTTQRRQAQLALQQAHERISLATESGGIGVWELDPQAATLVWNPWMWRLFGGRPDGADMPRDATLDRWILRVHPKDRRAARLAIEAADRDGHPVDSELRVVWPDGSVHNLRVAARMAGGDDGRPRRLTGVCWDVTEPRQLQRQLEEQRELLAVTLQSIGDAVITTDARGRVNWLNPAAARLTGWSSDEARGRPLREVYDTAVESTGEPVDDPVAACLATDAPVAPAVHKVLVALDGRSVGIEDSAAPIRDQGGRVLGVVLVFRDVSDQRRLAGEMLWRATHDALTGLVNRSEFETRLRAALNRSRGDGSPHALLYIDLDQFKLVNDACGHAVGDLLLQQVARLLSGTLRASDTLARLGGDEFAAILDHCSADQAQRAAQKMCDVLDEFRFAHDDRRFRIGASIGVVPVDRRWATSAAILQAADSSCYAAKEAGRNRIHLWFDTDQAMQTRQGEGRWAARIEQALDEDRFVLHHQRIVPVDGDAGGLHAEVLVRMVDVDGTLVPPGAFLPAAERFQLATRLDRWVLRRVGLWLQAMPDLAHVETICVNLSGQSVGDRAFHRQAVELLSTWRPAVLSRLCLEITETAAITSLVDAIPFIEQVRALGVRIALDDFGAGASSFGYLKRLPVDVLKIDGQFVRDLLDDPLDRAAIGCFVEVARVVGVKTVAEFVESDAVLGELRALGVDFAQGYLVHRPQPLPADGTPIDPAWAATALTRTA